MLAKAVSEKNRFHRIWPRDSSDFFLETCVRTGLAAVFIADCNGKGVHGT